MGDCCGGWSGELYGEKMCKLIENGEVVSYNWENGKFVKTIYKDSQIIKEVQT